jgi:hypothetical protein
MRLSAPRRNPARRRAALAALALGGLLATAAAGCASSDTGTGSTDRGQTSDTSAPAGTAPTGTVAPRPPGPAATIAGPLTAGNGVFLGASSPAGPALEAAGYVEQEYTASGTATSYTAPGGLPTDGTYELEPGTTADFTTRIVVRRPGDPAAFNGAVAVEWLNVSGGVDAAPDYTYLQEELLREGYAWVGVSAQRIGVEGGTVAVKAPGAEESGAGKGLKAIDAERYGELSHPGDAYMYDLYTQVARSLLEPGATDPLDGLEVRQLLAVGESQSAFALTTYYNGVQPLTEAFDGFFIHSRGGAPAPIEAPSGAIDIAGSIAGAPTTLRTDEPTPVIVVQTEGDMLGVIRYLPARQPDSEHVRVWEVAGAAHADAFQVGEMGAGLGCTTPINDGQQTFVLRAALRQLHRWAADGTAPPSADPIDVDSSGAAPTFLVDEVGNVTGGVRTPVVDAPVDVLSGLAPEGSSIICLLFGSTTPIPPDVLAARYPSADAYLEAYTAATDAAIEAGFVLEDDREAILDDADPSRIPG